MKQLVIYHAHCTDGVAAAVAHRLSHERQPRIDSNDNSPRDALDQFDYVPMTHGTLEDEAAFFEVIKGYHSVLFVDFGPTEPLLHRMLNENIIVTIFDHHKTTYDMIRNFGDVSNEQLRVVFSTDNKLSGATLTWLLGLAGFKIKSSEKLCLRDIEIHGHKFLTNMNLGFIRKETIEFKDPLYNLIGIRDVWDESNPALKRKADALHAYFDFNDLRNFDKFYDFVKSEKFVFHGASIVDVGETILEINKRNCESAIKSASKTTVTTDEGDIELCVGICPDGQGSQFGQSWGEQNEGKPNIAIAVFMNFEKATVTLGFRSRGIDALRIVETFPGGGGHPNACGCRITDTALTYDYTVIKPKYFIESLVEVITERMQTAYAVETIN